MAKVSKSCEWSSLPFRPRFGPILTLLLLLPFVGCTTATQSLQIIPANGGTLSAAGQTLQFHAAATTQTGSSPATTQDVTASAVWSSSAVSIATVSSTGLATAVGSGTTQIVASYGGRTATSILTVGTTSSTGGQGQPTLTIIPGSGAVTSFVGETTQFLAIGTLAGGGLQQDLTRNVRWVSSNPSVATIDQNGLATTIGSDSASGSTTITAIATTSSGGALTATTTLSANLTSGSANHPTLAIIPNGGAFTTFVGETTQYIAIGNLGSGGATQDLTNRVKWISSDVSVATIDQGGLATGVNANVAQPVTTTITAVATTVSGSIATASATLTALPAGGKVNLPTLSLYKVGNGSGRVFSTPAGLNCGTQDRCTGYFVLGSTVTLAAIPDNGSTFAGWSANCQLIGDQCALVMSNNDTVGAIFNKP